MLVVGCLVATAPVAAVSAGAVADASAPSADAPGSLGGADRVSALGPAPGPLQQTANATNNSTGVIHENPDEVDDENELDRLLSYLSGELNGDIGASTLRLSQGEYAAAKAALGDDYDDSLGKYVDVEGEVGGDGAGEEYRTVSETQRGYVDTVSEFRETRREYEAARRAGNDERARELARNLTRLAENGEAQSDRLLTAFDVISNRTDGDLAESSAQLAAVQANISEQRDEIVSREFVATRLAVGDYDRNISFTDPLVLSGSLVTDNGTPVETGSARFAVGGQTVQSAVDPDGSFELTYRPTRIPVSTESLTVRYLPDDASMYQATERVVPVAVSRVNATARLSEPSASAYGYADAVSVRATVRVNGTPVSNYPVSASFAGSSATAPATNASGASAVSATVPATATGTASIRVAPDGDSRAVTFVPATVAVPLETEGTALGVTARETANESVVVDGRLETDEGEAVSGQSVAVSVDGREVAAATTGASGAYRAAVDLPSDASVENATVSVAFDGEGTNLEPSDATASIRLSNAPDGDGAGNGASGGLPFDPLDLAWVVAGTAVVGLVAAVLLRRNDADDAAAATVAESAATESDEPAEPEPAATEASALDSAADALDEGRPNDAVVVAYAGVRRALGAAAGIDDAATHWEFCDRCVDAGVAPAEALESLTAGYERAAYSGLSVSDADAAELVETARSVVAPDETGLPESSDSGDAADASEPVGPVE
ncbi:hypothetical protein C454_11593 [Haloferax gibbonsii ATCC 33959]|uniref:Protein-glutamine gamma-glutamyltransferase-like C-terminal domain-containing protein n=1 Tax=Haloferax gibbonsii (strain ATCC 33959 / DSM 4427 / JCM 8863 / NBRC 102184 / NCIMB 2188 / Ma 2.38) TaxID=1227459 RepID=M0H9P0_HALGM|nr:DUF4129 domain-containing protein [Haloferax gibbonsii]ELZ79844.1 hypothetical protein C454_11593 [Haloferax gibbonsii ATCC 33959]